MPLQARRPPSAIELGWHFRVVNLRTPSGKQLIAKLTLLHRPLNDRSKPAQVDLRTTLHMRGRLAKKDLGHGYAPHK